MMRVATESGWRGAFSPVAFTNVLKRAADEGQSGELQIVSGNWVKTVRIDEGAVRFARSNMRQDRLGESMLAHECISPSDYRLASERMASDGCRFGEALLKMGRLDRSQLHRELGVQVQRIVLSLFRVRDGLYSFEAADTPSRDVGLPFSLSVPSLILKGLRRIDDGRMILSALPPADTVVRMSAAPRYNIDLKKLAALERTVLEKAGDGATIGAIVRDGSFDRSNALRVCYALLTLGLLETVGADPAPQDIASSPAEGTGSHEVLGVEDEAPADIVAAELVDDAPEPSPEAPADEGADAVRRNRIEQLERDARLHIEVKDWNGASSLLHELVALEPKNAAYQLMLGQAMQCHPTQSKTAEEHFVQAVELAPEDPSVHVALGRYYQRAQKHGRAIAELRKALELDPTNEEAKKYLEAQPPPKRMSRLLKKLFG